MSSLENYDYYLCLKRLVNENVSECFSSNNLRMQVAFFFHGINRCIHETDNCLYNACLCGLRLHWNSQEALVVKNTAANAGNIKEIQFPSWVGKIPSKEGNDNPLPYSCLENPTDREAWRATVHMVTKNQTQLKQLGTHAAWVDYVFSQDLWGKNDERKGEVEAGIGDGTNKLVVLSSSYLIR